ncbi:malto-oligosyltrehalose synthase [Enhydrobacter sp.]|jgi:malto-oligosyltrehalose synthase|uniref:malto-oligosyltrehalose synthase n=1 Tax=Enhydrobacter sp. TaxID=1894999 RepID=UPI0026287AA9|nr:malto-oligosyltrehalose synthase [Enhydrobacter sp.]WIM12641.1 MAG: Malto-oligosyltrehalose synthase [Enhydrobacter sp.]
MMPRATLRLQFHKDFTFADAERLVPYMAALGVSHLYASPITAARAGSMHGYDVIDPTRVNPELGGEDGLRRLVEALRRQGLGLIVDIVPNHMAASLENPWWADVLHHGEASRYARSFDIDWETEDPQLRGRVFLPLLGRPLHEAIAAKEVTVGDREGWAVLRYYDHQLPMTGPDIERQPYRLGWWRTANDRINWRRFFDINDLVCLRMEDAETFENVHALIFRLYREGLIDGVRVDHVDGLNDPASYCRKLRHQLDPDDPSRPYLVVEKILLKGETLPADWACDGTTGYDFMDQVSALQHDPEAGPLLARAWTKLSGRPADFADEEEAARREIIAGSFAAPLEAAVAAFDRLAKADPAASELSRPALRRALIEMLVHFPVYRSYATPTERPRRDRPYLDAAARNAKRTARPSDGWIIDLLHRWLTEPTPDDAAIGRFQQLSAPVAAKSVEDTAFYRYGRLLSRNDVGFDLDRFGIGPGDFHALMQARSTDLPRSMLATATHDHKRGEDVRARLAVLSEQPQTWADRLTSWIDGSAVLRTDGQPAVGDIAMLLQMIVGAWPLDLVLEDAKGRAAFAARLAAWQEKALREAKIHTDWSDPDKSYEDAARRFVERLVAANALPDLIADIFSFIQSIAAAGAVNGLAQAALKLSVPGIPDLYQGTDYWDLSLVDPDNRRPVDFERRRRSLSSIDVADALGHWRDGRIKQALIARLLAVRATLPELFARGDYRPVPVEGEKAQHLVAFLRTYGENRLLVAVPRLPHALLRARDTLELDPAAWKDTSLVLPHETPWFDTIEGRTLQATAGKIRVQDLFTRLPVAIFSTKRS